MVQYPYALRYQADDPALLLPSFQPVVERIFARMQDLGFQPIIFDTLRTQAEADRNAAKGTGSKTSLHLFGAAVDMICNRHGWACKAKDCRFYDTLRKLYLKECYIGPAGDMPHGQALPVGQQVNFRRLPPEQRDVFVKVWLAKRS